MADLRTALGSSVPPELDALPAERQAQLAALVAAAASRRAEAMDDAIEESLRHLPALLRGTVRRTLGV